jgi:hypothetical protein
MNPLDPARLLLRLLDDLHAIAEAARCLTASERPADRPELERLTGDLRALADTARSLPRVEKVLTARIEELDARLAGVLDVAERIEESLPSIDRVLASIEALGDAAGTLALAVGPLQGAAERLGRVADRLPGGARART